MPESSIDILVHDAEPFVGEWYGRTEAAADGMPPHLTLLWPWRTAPLPESDLAAAREALGDLEPFRLTFRSFGRFPGVLYLVPEPEEPVRKLIGRLAAAFPDSPPYGGKFASPTPHLTVAKQSDDLLHAVESDVRAKLGPQGFSIDVDSVSVSEEGISPEGRWGVRASLNLTRRA